MNYNLGRWKKIYLKETGVDCYAQQWAEKPSYSDEYVEWLEESLNLQRISLNAQEIKDKSIALAMDESRGASAQVKPLVTPTFLLISGSLYMAAKYYFDSAVHDINIKP